VQHLTKVELLRFLTVAKEKRERDWLMFLVAYWHGLRASEVTALTADAVSDGKLSVHRLKGSEATVQKLEHDDNPLLDERSAVETLARSIPCTSRLFPFSRVHYFRLFRQYARLADIPEPKRHPHTLKHSIARHSILKAGIHNVKKRLGHKSMASTGVYLEASDEEADRAISQAFGHTIDDPEQD